MALIEIRGFNLHTQNYIWASTNKKTPNNHAKANSPASCLLNPGTLPGFSYFPSTIPLRPLIFSVSFSMWDKGTHTCNILIS